MLASRFILAATLAAAAVPLSLAFPRKPKSDLAQVLARMNDAAKRLKTVTSKLDYTTVTVLVNDRETETGQFFFSNPKNPEILINFTSPDPKTFLYRHNEAEIYYPKLNRIEQYNLQRQSGLIQQFMLLGFGTDQNALKANYNVTMLDEEDLQGESTIVLQLIPRDSGVKSQLTKVQLWISEDSWLPAQQQFYEPDGDYLIAHYTDTRVNRPLPGSTFQINAQGAQHVKKS